MEEPAAEGWSAYTDTAVEMVMLYAPRALLAIIVLIVGWLVINRMVDAFGRTMEARRVEVTLARFLKSLLGIGFKALLIISVASMVGIATTSFIAVLGAAGLAIGLALQGSLANFAGGVLILLFRPYKVGDFIEAQGVTGTVDEIQIFNTVMKTPDNRVIIVPNGPLSNGIITNYSAESTRRVELVFRIAYDDDVATARQVIERCIAEDERPLAEPAPSVDVTGLRENGVDITVRVWANAADNWGLFTDLTERVKLAFDDAGISIPHRQRYLPIGPEAGAQV